tara:strand:- start:593 stop:1024 length:432 start_codon:yes stop_codon:yes gene_type:complete
MHSDLKPSTIWYDSWNFQVVGHTNQKEYREQYSKALSKRRKTIKRREKDIRKAKCYKYNITEEQLDKLWEEAWCHICGITQTELNEKHKNKKTTSVSKLNIDHCHKTGKVGKLLCNRCNTALGFLQDSPELLRRSIQYIKENR